MRGRSSSGVCPDRIGDVTVLAWIGTSPLRPRRAVTISTTAEIDDIIMRLRSSLQDVPSVVSLYKQLTSLFSPSFAASRLRLPGMPSLSLSSPRNHSQRQASALIMAQANEVLDSLIHGIEVSLLRFCSVGSAGSANAVKQAV